MKAVESKPAGAAFTLIELLVVIGILLLLACFFLPSSSSTRTRAPRTECEDNLKQVGLAFRTWAIDGGDGFPMYDPTNSGGTKELITSGQVFVHFRPMSNELSTPKLLVCPQDAAKVAAASFNLGFSDTNVSYLVGTDAQDLYPRMFLSGDRNIAFNNQPIKPGLFALTTNNPAVSWTRAVYNFCGNMLFADSSVRLLDSTQLTSAARDPEANLATNRLAIP